MGYNDKKNNYRGNMCHGMARNKMNDIPLLNNHSTLSKESKHPIHNAIANKHINNN